MDTVRDVCMQLDAYDATFVVYLEILSNKLHTTFALMTLRLNKVLSSSTPPFITTSVANMEWKHRLTDSHTANLE